jgi:hypothetical protein
MDITIDIFIKLQFDNMETILTHYNFHNRLSNYSFKLLCNLNKIFNKLNS